jgi:MFS family permease
MGIVNALAGIVSTGLAMLTTDHLGRRFIFCLGAAVQCVALFAMAGLGMVVPSTHAIGVAIVCMMTVYGLGYGYGSSSVNHVLIAEVPHHTLRDKTQRICGWTNNLTA